jgi:hypothetical protein
MQRCMQGALGPQSAGILAKAPAVSTSFRVGEEHRKLFVLSRAVCPFKVLAGEKQRFGSSLEPPPEDKADNCACTLT